MKIVFEIPFLYTTIPLKFLKIFIELMLRIITYVNVNESDLLITKTN